jgi:RNA polymerase sigma-70 factor (ECF subfamily)
MERCARLDGSTIVLAVVVFGGDMDELIDSQRIGGCMGLAPCSPTGRYAWSTKLEDPVIVAGVLDGAVWAKTALFDKYEQDVRNALRHIVGPDPELPDMVQDVFADVLEDINRLRCPQQLRNWITTIAVRTGRQRIRHRRRHRWLLFVAPADVPEPRAEAVDPECREAVCALVRLLDRMRPGERAVFALRMLAGMELKEIAATCGISVATVKRRLNRARCRFVRLAAQDPNLSERCPRSALRDLD